jgi:hypothetical protein
MRKDIFGYYENPTDEKPAHDPGLNTICVICAKPLSVPLKTISLMKDKDTKSYFYRCHKECYERLSELDINLIESSLIDNL